MAIEEMRVSLRITGFSCSGEAISAALGIDGTETWQSGDPVPKTAMRRVVNGWVLRSPLPEGRELEPHILWLLDRLPHTLNSLVNVTTEYAAEFSCGVYTREEMPVLALSPETVARIAALEAAIDIDVNLVA